jgi:hypothetical protein
LSKLQYVETTALLHRRAAAEGKRDYKLKSDTFPDSQAATKYVLDFLGSRRLLEALDNDSNSRIALESVILLMEQHRFNIQLDPVWGKPQREKDDRLLASLKATKRDERASAILRLIYSIRCNMFHGRKGFTERQEELLVPVTVILSKIIELLFSELESAGYVPEPAPQFSQAPSSET